MRWRQRETREEAKCECYTVGCYVSVVVAQAFLHELELPDDLHDRMDNERDEKLLVKRDTVYI